MRFLATRTDTTGEGEEVVKIASSLAASVFD